MELFDERLKDFSGRTPLFPLPNVVFFPKTFLPLYIFEPRYRQMMVDAELGDKMICMAHLKPGYEDDNEGLSPIYSVGSLGYMEFKGDRSDGSSNILLVGLAKVKIKEVVSEHDYDYRLGELTLLTESRGEEDTELLKEKVFRGFERMSANSGFPQIPKQFKQVIDFEMAVNFLASHIPIESIEKQKMLELDDISLRAKILVQFMESGIGMEEMGGFGSIAPGDPRLN
ncbi:MAG: LON peptidase substrate-binding domain-containing protein [Candidatus Neomarinimicrobiota bacterium]|nr:LON peptidase substrate-binding domain-containing protein [Candidatus Neomarinimicrobiota bacterium]